MFSREKAGDLMKPRQHTRTEGCPRQHKATCVTGDAWRTSCPVRGDRVTTDRSTIVARPQSGLLGRWAYYPASEVARIFIGGNEA